MRRIAAALALLPLMACQKPRPLPVLGQIPDFTLTAQTGLPFQGASLRGHLWVANFMFTSCMGPCPRMGSQMRLLRNELRDLPDVRFVSMTVDTEHDTPEVLAAYAKRFQADPEKWHFLTGPRAVLHDLCRNAFHLGNVDGSLVHSTRFTLVDRQGRIRGYYDSSEADALKKLSSDIRALARESS